MKHVNLIACIPVTKWRFENCDLVKNVKVFAYKTVKNVNGLAFEVLSMRKHMYTGNVLCCAYENAIDKTICMHTKRGKIFAFA